MSGSATVSGIKLNDGNVMPMVGEGTFQGTYDFKSNYDVAKKAAKLALDLGYRHFDTAALYETEKPLGDAIRDAIREGTVKREDLYIVTKLWCTNHRKESVVPALRRSLQQLNLDYVNMYLIHWPMAFKPGNENFPRDESGKVIVDDDTDITETWKGMMECKQLGLTRSIGVSNFNIEQIQRLLNKGLEIPANLQQEVNVYYEDKNLIDFCKKHNIVISAYSPLSQLGKPWERPGLPSLATDTTLNSIGKAHGKTPSQVALRFLIDQGFAVIPKANSYEHLKENLDIINFQLTPDDMNAIFSNCVSLNYKAIYLKELLGHLKEFPFKDYPNQWDVHQSF